MDTSNTSPKKAEILSVPFDVLTCDEALALLSGFLQSAQNHLVVTPNPECVMVARRDPAYLHILQTADLVFADGTGILLASRWLRKSLPERVRGVDMTLQLLDTVRGTDKTVYLLGAAAGVAEKAAQKLAESGVTVAGARDGFFEEGAAKEAEILAELNRIKPNILIVGMGMPRQEKWAFAHKDKLPCKVMLCVGGTIDVLAGNAKLAPAWLRAIGLEWLYRLLMQPSRAKRMLALPRFALLVLRQRRQKLNK